MERKIRADERELRAFLEGYAAQEWNEALEEWNYTSNYVRPHLGLG